jgi:hypothetical protein
LRLVDGSTGQVYRNDNNGSFYRYEGQVADQRVRIFSLELFPNGLLISKPTPTTVGGDIEVTLVGPWREDMVVQGRSRRSRRALEDELVRLERQLPELLRQYDELSRSGTGEQSRGSFANKIKSTRLRIDTLKRGLGFVGAAAVVSPVIQSADVGWQTGQRAQVPSGRIAVIEGFVPMGDTVYAQLKTVFQGAAVMAALPCEVLRPAREARLCTV